MRSCIWSCVASNSLLNLHSSVSQNMSRLRCSRKNVVYWILKLSTETEVRSSLHKLGILRLSFWNAWNLLCWSLPNLSSAQWEQICAYFDILLKKILGISFLLRNIPILFLIWYFLDESWKINPAVFYIHEVFSMTWSIRLPKFLLN